MQQETKPSPLRLVLRPPEQPGGLDELLAVLAAIIVEECSTPAPVVSSEAPATKQKKAA